MLNFLEPYEFCGIPLRNRIVRSATLENLATSERTPSPQLHRWYAALAEAQVGLIVTGAVRPERSWDPHPGGKNLCIDRDEMVAPFRDLVARVHDHGGRIAVQLGSFFRYAGESVGPSALPGPNGRRALSTAEIRQIVARYAEAGERCRRAGFDALQVNAAHGFPLAQFLSPAYNRRQDEYGGATLNRARIVGEIASGIKRSAGADFTVFVKMNVEDFLEEGLTTAEAARVVGILSRQGIDAVEASGGGVGHGMSWLGPAGHGDWSEGYLRPHTAALKSAVDVPVVMVGGLRRPAMMEEIIRLGEADLVAMSRPFIREPGLIRRWLRGDLTGSGCTACNGCLQQVLKNQPVACVGPRRNTVPPIT